MGAGYFSPGRGVGFVRVDGLRFEYRRSGNILRYRRGTIVTIICTAVLCVSWASFALYSKPDLASDRVAEREMAKGAGRNSYCEWSKLAAVFWGEADAPILRSCDALHQKDGDRAGCSSAPLRGVVELSCIWTVMCRHRRVSHVERTAQPVERDGCSQNTHDKPPNRCRGIRKVGGLYLSARLPFQKLQQAKAYSRP